MGKHPLVVPGFSLVHVWRLVSVLLHLRSRAGIVPVGLQAFEAVQTHNRLFATRTMHEPCRVQALREYGGEVGDPIGLVGGGLLAAGVVSRLPVCGLHATRGPR